MKYIPFLLLFAFVACETPVEQKSDPIKKQDEPVIEPGKMYKIGKINLIFRAPLTYKDRLDQFEENRKKGDKGIEENGGGATTSTNDNILVSVGKSADSDLNVLLVSERPNIMITRFGIDGYRDKVIEMFEYSLTKDGTKHNSFADVQIIDGVTFHTLLINIFDEKDKYLYTNMMYITELDAREFSYTAVYDNDDDRQTILAAILDSKFEKE